MRFTVAAETDIGISKSTNQDSVGVKLMNTEHGQVLMALVCDGMGGLSKGELASATVIREFIDWFDHELPRELEFEQVNMEVIGGKWSWMLKSLNTKIMEYGKKHGVTLGTTFTGMLFIGEQYLIAHVGDTRAYHIATQVHQLTEDQTLVAREIKHGRMTVEEAKVDRRRNMLLQCVGASQVVEPEVIIGETQKGMYLMCSDGFRHVVSMQEIGNAFNPHIVKDKTKMSSRIIEVINVVKARHERDNITGLLIRVD